ncbi:MAG TPA: UbiA prenyltransferase family protein [Saprospiraceae bacterium]|nr:UbiA prenyltransferase family protein [Saprospiraceae bacterium]
MAIPINTILHALRYKHWIKNVFIFVPLFFGQQLLTSFLNYKLWLAFICFCLLTSMVYLFNDLVDVNDDKLHPENRKRAYASGLIAPHEVLNLMGILAIPVLILGAISHILLPVFLYFILNIAYSLKLKSIPILDIIILSLGFIFRLWAGASATNIPLSIWLILITFLLALFLALGKRRSEKIMSKTKTIKIKSAVSFYKVKQIDIAMYVLAGLNCLAYFAYTIAPEVTTRFQSDKIYITVFFVLLGYVRYFFIIRSRPRKTTPVSLLFEDRYLYLIIIGWVLTFYWLIYV